MEPKLSNHVLVCGWNQRGDLIVSQLRSEDTKSVVIVADLEQNPVRFPDVHFVAGRPSRADVLRRANVSKAQAAIVLADESHGPADDAHTLLCVLAIESLAPSVYTVVEVLDPQNIEHMQRANADEVLSSNEAVPFLLSRSALYHGVIPVVSEICKAGEGSEFYAVPILDELVERSFDEALLWLRTHRNCILVGVRHDGRVHVNPRGNRILQRDDHLIVIAEESPV